jgi:hypothetical protein
MCFYSFVLNITLHIIINFNVSRAIIHEFLRFHIRIYFFSANIFTYYEKNIKINIKLFHVINVCLSRIRCPDILWIFLCSQFEYALRTTIARRSFVAIPMVSFLRFLLSIYDGNESIDFVHGKWFFFHWHSGRLKI